MANNKPLSQREEWSDVKPLPEFEAGAPIAQIDYSPECTSYAVEEVMGYFRAIVKANEVSQRAFDLTTEVIQMNPGFYTAW